MAHAEQVIRALMQNIAVEQKFTAYDLQVTPISTGGANYTSHLFIATLSEEKKELNVFAKVAALGEKMRSQVPVKMYDIERLFYRDLVKTFRHLEEKNCVAEEHRLKVPEFYGFSEKLYEETIVLENLTKKGYTTHDRFKSVDWEYAAASITELAKFHALAVAYQLDNPEDSEKIIAELSFDFNDDESQTKPMWEKMVDRAVETAHEENRDKLKTFIERELKGFSSFRELFSPIRLTVIGHGDYRPSNLMHRIQEDGTVEVIAVDYQTLRGGCPVVDLLYFIFTGTDSQFRKQYYTKLINHYYEQLAAALTRLGMNPEEKYSREDFEFELKEKLPFGLAVAVFTLPIVTVESENAPKVDEKMELSDFSIQKTGSLFPERLNGIVDDFVSWGVI